MPHGQNTSYLMLGQERAVEKKKNIVLKVHPSKRLAECLQDSEHHLSSSTKELSSQSMNWSLLLTYMEGRRVS